MGLMTGPFLGKDVIVLFIVGGKNSKKWWFFSPQFYGGGFPVLWIFSFKNKNKKILKFFLQIWVFKFKKRFFSSNFLNFFRVGWPTPSANFRFFLLQMGIAMSRNFIKINSYSFFDFFFQKKKSWIASYWDAKSRTAVAKVANPRILFGDKKNSHFVSQSSFVELT